MLHRYALQLSAALLSLASLCSGCAGPIDSEPEEDGSDVLDEARQELDSTKPGVFNSLYSKGWLGWLQSNPVPGTTTPAGFRCPVSLIRKDVIMAASHCFGNMLAPGYGQNFGTVSFKTESLTVVNYKQLPYQLNGIYPITLARLNSCTGKATPVTFSATIPAPSTAVSYLSYDMAGNSTGPQKQLNGIWSGSGGTGSLWLLHNGGASTAWQTQLSQSSPIGPMVATDKGAALFAGQNPGSPFAMVFGFAQIDGATVPNLVYPAADPALSSAISNQLGQWISPCDPNSG